MNTATIAYLLVVEERAGLDATGLTCAVVVWDAGKEHNLRLIVNGKQTSLWAAILEFFHVETAIPNIYSLNCPGRFSRHARTHKTGNMSELLWCRDINKLRNSKREKH